MEIMSLIGVFVIIIGGIGFLIAAFRTSIIWGLACLLIAPVSIVYLVLHWPEAKNPFFIQLAGLAILIVAGLMGSEMPL